MSVNKTEEQLEAVGRRGRVIVSASAGSGKTFVMIERLVSLILSGTDVRRVLAVTFTNKAAAQMREKLRSALIQKISETAGEEKARLKEQLAALPLAEISTIHAFCARLVRANFFLADVDTAFRIISPDDAEGKALSARAMDEAFEAEYEEGGEDFYRLLSVYFRQKKDARLRGIVLSLYQTCRGLSDYREIFAAAGEADLFEEACDYLAEDVRSRAAFYAEKTEEAGAFFAERQPRVLEVVKGVLAAAEGLLEKRDLFEMAEYAAQNPVSVPRMPPKTKAEEDVRAQMERLSALSDGVKDLYKELGKFGGREEERARYFDARERASALGALALRYDEAYSRLKKEAGVLDYDDLEHCALAVLTNEEARADVAGRYDYVFVDEYQDVNPAQEKIISLVGGEEVFLVGDLKQSIYGFRGSRSEYFARKAQEFEHALYLSENFRSSAAVLEAVNRVFTYAMTEDTCGFSYAETSHMRGGRRYGDWQGEVKFHRVAKEKAKRIAPSGVYSVLADKGSIRTDEQSEAIADIVQREFGSVWYDADEGREKTVGYGDVAVLVRKTTGDAERVVAALSARGIPVTAVSKVNVCDFWEARLLIDWLSFLDNAEQDIPLAGAMLSSLGGFSDGELAQIRLAPTINRKIAPCFTFRSACEEYRGKMADGVAEKLNAFARNVDRLRALSRVLSAREISDLLLSEGLEAEIASKKDGMRRLGRIRRFTAAAEGSVHEFLRKLKASDYRVDYSESGGEDAVKVLTMHASKGLEYPVVILASLDAPFHGAERDEVMWTERFRFAPKSYDAEKKLVYETVLRRASAVQQEREELKGELNLFYVAMTRARYRLHLVFGEREGALSPRFADRFSDFIDFSDCAHYFTKESAAAPPEEKEALVYLPDEEKKARILAEYKKPYRFLSSTFLPVKSSATELMRQADGEFSRGDYLVGEEGGTAEEGIAYHAFLQYVRFGEDAGRELSRMREKGILSAKQIALLDVRKLEKILAVPCLKWLAGKRIERERKFLLSLPANELMPTEADDEIVYQGAIDLLCLDENGYTVIDYKYSSRGDDSLREHYALQIALYKKAVARIMRVDESTVRACIVNILACREIEM